MLSASTTQTGEEDEPAAKRVPFHVLNLSFPRNNKAVYKEAHFDGKVLRVKSPSTKKPLPAKGGYS